MKKINKKMLIITSIACLLPIILGMVLYQQLPEKIAIHFNVNNIPDNYFAKPTFVFGMPIMMLALQIFCCAVTDLTNQHPEANKKTITIYKWIIPILEMALYLVTILYAMGNQLDIRKVVMVLIGILFIIIGNYLPKLKGNTKFARIKDENLKEKLTRISGYTLILNGFLCMISILFQTMVSVVAIGIVILEAIILSGYSLVKSKNS